MSTSKPSEQALEAAAKAEREAYARHEAYPWQSAVKAVHAAELGVDRSVCLKTILDYLRADQLDWMMDHIHRHGIADDLEKHFGGAS